MHVFYEDSGDFRVATLQSENGGALHIEDERGKRGKIKAHDVRVRFTEPALNQFLLQARTLAEAIDLDFLWEATGEGEFGFQTIAQDYYGHPPTPLEAAALCLRLHGAPAYFYRKGRGVYRAAPEENLRAAKLALEKKAHEAIQLDAWKNALLDGQLPAPLAAARHLLHKPDRTTLEWRALSAAAEFARISPLRLMERCGALTRIEDWLLEGFLLQHFPQGTGHPADLERALERAASRSEAQIAALPLAEVAAFSIDDVEATEIDDAFSVTPQADGTVRVGIHIAVPALEISPEASDVDEAAVLEHCVRTRLSTVYFPGGKIPMLPERWIERYTLAAGRSCPALSLYLVLEPDFTERARETRLERVPMVENFRHHRLGSWFHAESLISYAAENPVPSVLDPVRQVLTGNPQGSPLPGLNHPFAAELVYLWLYARQLERARGKYDPTRVERPDYHIALTSQEGDLPRVSVQRRERGDPMDKLVAELMILCNSSWGKQLAEKKLPAIYRVQTQGKVQMSTQPQVHVGLGVTHYSWASSPLRRAVDFINQQQLLAWLAIRPARHAPRDPLLYGALRDFDQAHQAYLAFQDRMEHYWSLRYLQQESIQHIEGNVIRDTLVRIDGLPMLTRVESLTAQPRGTRVRLQCGVIDLLTQTVELRVLEVVPPPRISEQTDEADPSYEEEDRDGAADRMDTAQARIAEEQQTETPAGAPEAPDAPHPGTLPQRATLP